MINSNMYYTVYKITNIVDNKVYIGTHQTENLDDGYYGSGKLIKRAIGKHGLDKFKKEYLHIFDNSEKMFEAEAVLVDSSFVADNNTYNLVEGGNGGWGYINTEQLSVSHFETVSKDKLQEYQQKGKDVIDNKRKNDPEFAKRWANNISKARKGQPGTFAGKHHREDSKKKIGEANSKHQQGINNSQYGTCWIYSLQEKKSTKIQLEDLQQYLLNGWVQGRKMKF